MRARLDRREFLLATGAVAAAACSSDTGRTDPSPTNAPAAPVSESDRPQPSAAPSPATDAPGTTAEPAAEDPAATPAAPATVASSGAPGVEPLTAARFDDVAVCTLLPAAAAGPFPTVDPLDRRDVTEGHPGHPLRLGLRVVDGACRPIPDALVEIWHADATGDYSSYVDGGSGKDEGPGTTFLRGVQVSDGEGIVEFQTIYPGWYGGRAVHVHLAVRLDGTRLLTAQLYFDEAYTAEVYATDPYAAFGPPDTGWADDGLIGDPPVDGTGIVLAAAPTDLGEGTLGLVNVGVPA